MMLFLAMTSGKKWSADQELGGSEPAVDKLRVSVFPASTTERRAAAAWMISRRTAGTAETMMG